MIELVESTAATVEHYPQVLPSSVAATLRDASGESIETPTVTIDSTDTTIDTVTSPTEWTLADGTGITAGRHYWWAGARGGAGPVLVVEVNGAAVVLDSAPPGIVRTGDAVKGLRCTAPLTASTITPRGEGWRIDWVTTDADSVLHYYRDEVIVVRQKFAPPTTPASARTYVVNLWGSEGGSSVDPGRWIELSRKANKLVYEEARAQRRYPHLSGDSSVWESAGEYALDYLLAKEGLTPGGEDPRTYRMDMLEMVRSEIDRAIARSWVDRDDDGAFADAERPTIRSALGVRR